MTKECPTHLKMPLGSTPLYGEKSVLLAFEQSWILGPSLPKPILLPIDSGRPEFNVFLSYDSYDISVSGTEQLG